MTTPKYLMQVPLTYSVDLICVQYLTGLISAKCPNDIACTATDIPDVQIIGCGSSNDDLVLAKDLVNNVQWLSFRNWSDSSVVGLVQQLCGASKDNRRETGRALKRVMSWTDCWSDRTTQLSTQLGDPTCGIILFDKKLRHRSVKYMIECDANSTVKAAHLTIADIHLCMTISVWMAAFAGEKEYIVSIIPAIVNYVKSIRAELRRIESEFSGDGSVFGQYFDSDLWVDTAEVSTGNAHSFKFTQKQKAQQTNTKAAVTDVDMTKTETATIVIPTQLNLEEIENKAQELINMVPWHSAVAFDNTHLRDCEFQATTDKSTVPRKQVDFTTHDDMWEKMKLPAGREVRKTQQIKSLLREINAVLPEGGVAVEFCAGGGYVGIPLAVLRPDCMVLLTDMNTVSIQYAKARVERLGLTNVKFLREELAGIEARQQSGPLSVQRGTEAESAASNSECSELELLSKFHVGIALHACGTATDAVLRICTSAGASFVVSPCCYGFLQHQAGAGAAACEAEANSVENVGEAFCQLCVSAPTDSSCACTSCTSPIPNSTSDRAPYSSYPASQAFRTCGWQGRWFAALCSQADRTFWSHDARAGANNAKGHLAMRVVDTDRLLAAREQGYDVFGTFMWPAEASVKNHILVGAKRIDK